LSELMARVVSGIETPPAARALWFVAGGGVFTAGAASWGGAALDVFRLTSAVIASATAAMQKTIFHRACMKNLSP
jgi:hypothetical protein